MDANKDTPYSTLTAIPFSFPVYSGLDGKQNGGCFYSYLFLLIPILP